MNITLSTHVEFPHLYTTKVQQFFHIIFQGKCSSKLFGFSVSDFLAAGELVVTLSCPPRELATELPITDALTSNLTL
jgi:hypothetical protein